MAVWTPGCVYGSAVAFTAHASDPRIADALWFSTTAGAATCSITPKTSASVDLAGIPTGSVIPIRTRLVTALGGTNVVCIGLGDPCEAMYFNNAVAITPDDAVSNIVDAIYVSAIGGGTALSVTPRNGSAAVVFTVAAGQIVPIRTKLIDTNTTATVIGLSF